MWRKINSLIKVFLKDTYQNFKVFNIKTKKIEKKSIFLWMIFIIIIAISFISYKIINLLVSVGQPQIFLNIYFILLTILLMFQIILISTNVLFFSRELECVLYMPITSTELLISKLGVFLAMTYVTEGIFAIIPFTIYGLMVHISFLYFLIMPIVLVLFPVTLVSIIGLVTILLMKFSKIIRNRNVCQIIITVILLLIVIGFEVIVMNRFATQKIEQKRQVEQANEMYRHLGDGFFIINPSIEILSEPNKIISVFKNLFILFFYDSITIIIFILISKKVYLKNILLGLTNKMKDKKNVKIKKNKRHTKAKAYVIKEFKQLYRNPTFFMQLIFPVLLVIISILIISRAVIPIFSEYFQTNSSITEELESFGFNSEMLSIIFCFLQLMFSISNISLTAISREGENAIFSKYIPLDLYKQFLYKNVLQTILNIIVSIIVLTLIYLIFFKIKIYQILAIFICSIFIILINSYVLLIVDIKRPVLNWDSEYMLIKKNPNKIFKYVLIICMILIYLYLGNILKNINIDVAILIQMIIFISIFIVIDFVVKRKKDNLFKNIK